MLIEERKRKRRCEQDCTDHFFALEALKNNPSKYDIQLQLCPKYQRDPLPPESTYPEFNDDGLYYTSAFVLGVDKRILLKNQQQELMDHQKQIRDSLQKHNQLVFPRPNSKHSLCSVCKQHYKNYYIHIASQEHRAKIALSPYNTHIKDLCYLYIDLWEGAQERADEEAKKRAAEEEERRLKMLEEKQLQQEQEQSNSLLDCQRGQQDDEQEQEEEEFVGKTKNGRKSQKSIYNNEDTVPINGKSYKRGAPDKSLYQPPIRKRYTAGQFNPTHAARERKQRQYQRERDKMMRGTQFQFFKRNYKPRPGTQDDVFIVMEPISGEQHENVHQAPKTIQSQKMIKKSVQWPQKKIKPQIEKPQHQLQKNKQLPVKQSESVEDKKKQSKKQNSYKKKQQIQSNKQIVEPKQPQTNKIPLEEGELSNSSSESYSSCSRSQSKDNLTIKKHPSKRQEYPENKGDPRMQGYSYQYPPPPPMHVPHYHPKNQPLTPEQYNQAYKGAYNQYAEHYKNFPEGNKGMPPYYYNPYQYPMYDPIYMRPPPNEKVYQPSLAEKEKGKVHEKSYDYPMPYHWPYHPYYMPPMPPIPSMPPVSEQKPEHIASTSAVKTSTNTKPSGNREHSGNPYSGNTSININFPMYMFPPPHPSMQGYSLPPNRYPPVPPPHPMMNPYMGYPYGPYGNQQERNERQRESPPKHPSQHKDSRYQPAHGPAPSNYPNYNVPPNGSYHPSNPPHNAPPNSQNSMMSNPYNYPYPYHHYPPHCSREHKKQANKQV